MLTISYDHHSFFHFRPFFWNHFPSSPKTSLIDFFKVNSQIVIYLKIPLFSPSTIAVYRILARHRFPLSPLTDIGTTLWFAEISPAVCHS